MRLLALASLVAASLTISVPAYAKGKILFFDLESQPTTRGVAKRINASLRSWVNSSEGFSSMYGESLAETRRQHCKSAQLKRSFHACLARIGVREKADRLVIGSVLSSGPNYRVVLTIVDTANPTKAITITEQLAATSARGPALEAWIQKLFSRMFKSAAGYLIVSCNIDDVHMAVDKQRAGRCSTGITRLKLSPGKHRVSFRREGYVTVVHRLQVRGGETARLKVDLRLRPRPRPRPRLVLSTPRPAATTPGLTKKQRARRTAWRALFFSTLGTGLALAVASGFTAFKTHALQDEKDYLIRINLAGPSTGYFDNVNDVCASTNATAELTNVCKDGRRMATLTNVFIGVGVGLVATSVVFLYFAYIAKPKPQGEARATTASSLGLTPHIWKGGGGVTASVKF